jgi:hypothetical protein
MNESFTFRLDQQTSQLLRFLATVNHRSRAAILRLLIISAAKNPRCLNPQIEGDIDDCFDFESGLTGDTKTTEDTS